MPALTVRPGSARAGCACAQPARPVACSRNCKPPARRAPPPGSNTGLAAAPGAACAAGRRRLSSAAAAPAASPAPPPAATASSSSGEGDRLGVVIVDHGSRKAESNDMLLEFTELFKQVTGRRLVEPAHMELAEPTIEQAVAACVAAGATRVIVAPYFLSRGRHVQQDIPALVAAAAAQHPSVVCEVADPIGIDPLMAQLIENRVVAATAAAATEAAAAAAAAAPAGH